MIKDPRNVLIDVEGMEWDPQIPVAKAIELATEALQNYPSEIEFKVTLTGASASRFHFIKTILTSLGLTASTILYKVQETDSPSVCIVGFKFFKNSNHSLSLPS